MQEQKNSESSYFATLSYDPENLPLVDQWGYDVGSLYKQDLQYFMKKLRANLLRLGYCDPVYYKQSKDTGLISPKLRYYACGEYGRLGDRPHYHVILYNFPHYFVEYDPIFKLDYSELIEETWKKGNVRLGNVTRQSCHYVAKYSLGSLLNEWWSDRDNREKPFALMSRKPGIGSKYVDDAIKDHYCRSKVGYALVEGNYKQPIGRYIKDKVFEENEEAKAIMQRNSVKFASRAKRRYENSITAGKTGIDAERALLDARRIEFWENRKKLNRQIDKGKF